MRTSTNFIPLFNVLTYSSKHGFKKVGIRNLGSNTAQNWRNKFPNIVQNKNAIFCDGAAGTQVPHEVIDSMVAHLRNVGSTNVGGEYPTGDQALKAVTAARLAGKDLMGTNSTGEIAFG